MYTHQDERNVEAICYEESHVRMVLAEIKNNFERYFPHFIETEGGVGITEEAFSKLRRHFGIHQGQSLSLSA